MQSFICMKHILVHQFIGFEFFYESFFTYNTTLKEGHLSVDIIISNRSEYNIISMLISHNEPIGEHKVYPVFICCRKFLNFYVGCNVVGIKFV